jgi:amidohydrolase
MLQTERAISDAITSVTDEKVSAILAKWLDHAASLEEETITIRRHLHRHPELSFEEKATANFVYLELLSAKIFDIQRNVGSGYGIVAKIHGAAPGPTIALRADMDALPIDEETDLAFKSETPGVMHACGHDIHTAALLGVAQVLQANRADFAGTVILIFQHAEEVKPGGAKSIVEAGHLDDADLVFGIHVNPSQAVGTVGYSLKYGSAASDTFVIDIQGSGGHASSPHTTVDSVVVAAETITNLQTLVSRLSNPMDPMVVTVSSVDAGGGATNIIADTARIVGTVRSSSAKGREKVKEHLIQIAKMTAIMNGAEASVDYHDGYPAIVNSKSVVEASLVAIEASGVFTQTIESNAANGAMMNGEDFAYYLQKVPGAYFTVGVGPDASDGPVATYPLHNSHFVANEAGILSAMKLFLVVLSKHLKVVPHD